MVRRCGRITLWFAAYATSVVLVVVADDLVSVAAKKITFSSGLFVGFWTALRLCLPVEKKDRPITQVSVKSYVRGWLVDEYYANTKKRRTDSY
jgi:hypothetical protein